MSLVTGTRIARLSPDAPALLTSGRPDDGEAPLNEAETLRARLSSPAGPFTAGRISRAALARIQACLLP
jgi:hypothetical protein